MNEFLSDLDEYFCDKYANYDKICMLTGYQMPTMQTSKVDEYGRTYAYTLPASVMRLSLQEKKSALLQELKTRIVDKTFSFSFRPLGFFRRFGNVFSKKAPRKVLRATLEKYNLTAEEIGKELNIDEEIWTNICKGKFTLTQNAIYSLALVAHLSIEDATVLLETNGYAFNYAVEKDVVVSYLLEKKVYARTLIDAAFAEYKIANTFLK